MRIPIMDVKLAQEELRGQIGSVVARVMASGVYILGPELDSFEREFAGFCGVNHCLGTSSGYDALYLILRALNVGYGDHVIVPAHCFISLWFTVTAVGAVPVPVEPDPKTLNIDPAQIEAVITPQTKAIIALHLYGRPAEMAPILDIARPRGIKVIEEVSQAHGAIYRGRRVGSWGDAAAIDFYPTLNLGAAGDGGAVLTSDLALAERVKSLRNFGAKGKAFGSEFGITSRLGELQAAVLRVKLPRLDAWNLLRRKQADAYQKALAQTPGIVLPEESSEPDTNHVWHRYVVRHPHRDAIAKGLHQAGIQTLVHYAEPPYFAPPYQTLGYTRGSYPVAEQMCQEVLSLPIGPHLSIPQILHVAEFVEREARVAQGDLPPDRTAPPSPPVAPAEPEVQPDSPY